MNDKKEKNVRERMDKIRYKQRNDNVSGHSLGKKRKKKKNYKYIKYKIYVFAMCMALMTVISVIGRILPGAMDKEADMAFPTFELSAFATGDYFKQVNTWFSDSFPWSHIVTDNKLTGTKSQSSETETEQRNLVLFGRKSFRRDGLAVIMYPGMNERADALFVAMDKKQDIDPKTPMMALTFDDGPSKHTNRLLDILVENDVKATFYIVGSRIHYFPETVKRMADLNMEYGNHTYDHKYLTSLKGEEEYNQLEMVDNELRELSGVETLSIRPPGGRMDLVPSEYIDKPLILWSVDTRDWESRNAEAVAEHILAYAHDGAILLMHDLYESTVDAMEIVIPALKEQGYELVTVSKLAQIKGHTLEAGKSYTDFPLVENEE